VTSDQQGPKDGNRPAGGAEALRLLRIGVVGAGLIARRAHLPAYRDDPASEVVAIASRRAETASALAGEFGIPVVHETWQELVTDPRVEAVDVCAPNHLHAEVAIAAARAGKHVLVEKPMALSLAEADAMTAAARDAGVVLMVAHNLRLNPLYREVKRLVDAGAIGRPLSARGAFMHAGPDEFWGATSDWFWDRARAGGGSLLDMGIHMVDLMRWIIGRPVVEVAAMTSRLLKPTPFDDNAIVLLRFEGGLIASVQSSWTARPQPDRSLTVHGEKGYVAAGRSPSEPLVLHAASPEGAEQRTALPVPKLAAGDNPFAHFVRCVRGLEAPLVPGEEGRRTLAVVLAAYEAAASGRSVAVVPE
jgi:UDP-N-acetylglucosamine 3-dehydrogenase